MRKIGGYSVIKCYKMCLRGKDEEKEIMKDRWRKREREIQRYIDKESKRE